jgi:hypothetical protein
MHKDSSRICRVIVLMFSAALLISACERRSVAIVWNRSGQVLTDVRLSARAFSRVIGDLPAGAERRVVLDLPPGEQGTIVLTYRLNGVLHTASREAYFEQKGYTVKVTVEPDLKISTAIDLR